MPHFSFTHLEDKIQQIKIATETKIIMNLPKTKIDKTK